MEKKETLRQYLTYNKDIDEMNQIFLHLDSQLKYLHRNGYCVSELNSDTILLEEAKYTNKDNQNVFMFSSITKATSENDFSNNILDLSKLAIGAFISSENGFCDYSMLSTDYIKKYFEEIKVYLPNPAYYNGVIMNNDTSVYYSDYVQMTLGNAKANSNRMVKSNAYGKMYVPEDDAAFIQIVFYPVVILSIITIVAVLSKIIN